MNITSTTYRRSLNITFSAARTVGDILTGNNFRAVLVFEADELSDGEVIDSYTIKQVMERLHQNNLNDVMNPMIPTTENIAKFIGQLMLDYLFKKGLHEDVRLLLSRVIEAESDYGEVIYTY